MSYILTLVEENTFGDAVIAPWVTYGNGVYGNAVEAGGQLSVLNYDGVDTQWTSFGQYPITARREVALIDGGGAGKCRVYEIAVDSFSLTHGSGWWNKGGVTGFFLGGLEVARREFLFGWYYKRTGVGPEVWEQYCVLGIIDGSAFVFPPPWESAAPYGAGVVLRAYVNNSGGPLIIEEDSLVLADGHVAFYYSTDGGTHFTRAYTCPISDISATIDYVGIFGCSADQGMATCTNCGGGTVADRFAAYDLTASADATSPYLNNQNPAAGATVLAPANVQLDVLDAGEGVAATSVAVTIAGVVAWSNGAAQNGWSGTATPTAGGYHYELTPPTPFVEGSTITVAVEADDIVLPTPNHLSTSYWFATTAVPPYIADRDPEQSTQGSYKFLPVQLSILDAGTGVDIATVVITINGTIAWQTDAGANGWSGTRATVAGGYRYTLQPPTYLPLGLNTINVYAEDLGATPGVLSEAYSFTVVDWAMRVPVAGLYVDELRDTALDPQLILLNTIPEDGETGVPANMQSKPYNIRLHLVSIANEAINATVKVYITRSSDQVRRLAYDQAAGGFQSPYNGAASVATAQASPSSGVNDELILKIDPAFNFTSLEVVLVEVIGSTATYGINTSYSFTIEDLTAPGIDAILWLHPRKCRIRFNEVVESSSNPDGSTFMEASLDGVEVSSTSSVKLPGSSPTEDWVGKMLNLTGSAYPSNNRARPITSVDSTSSTVAVSTAAIWGGPLVPDDGQDRDEQGILVRERSIKASVSSYYLSTRLSEEGASSEALSAERVQCAYCPIPVTATLPTAAELPAGENPAQYVYLTWHDDISFGRLYAIHAVELEDLYENASTDASLNFQSPTFNAPAARLKLWENGLIPPPDRTDDLGRDQMLRKLVVVLQDVMNSLWYWVDQLEYLNDPSLHPDDWADYLLYDRANPFRFPLETNQQKRLLAAALPGFYKKVGTAEGIKEMLYLLLNIWFEITPYVEAGYWTLGVSRLGINTVLGPGTAWARNAYEIVSPVDLTDTQRRIVREVAQWADPLNLHLIRIVEPSTGSPLIASYWSLGHSALGLSTTLAGL